MNQKIIGKTAQEVVDNLTPTAKSWISKIIPVKGEIEENLSRLAREGKTIRLPFTKADEMDVTNLGGRAKELLNGILNQGFTEKEASQMENILNGLNGNNLDDIMSKLRNIAGTDAKRSGFIDLVEEDAAELISNANLGGSRASNIGGIDNTVTGLNKIINTPRAYFDVADPVKKKARITTAAVGYAGVTVGGRYLSGGTLTTDNYGQRDIAGVPFI